MTTSAAPPAITTLGPEPPDVEMRRLLGRCLSRMGYRGLLGRGDQDLHSRLSETVRGMLFWVPIPAAFGILAARELGFPSWVAGVLAVAVFVGVPLLTNVATQVLIVALVAWLLAGVAEVIWDSWGALLWSHAAPIAGVFTFVIVRWVFRVLRGMAVGGLVRGVSLLFPLALLFLVVPVLTADVWFAAAKLDPWRVAGVAAAVLLPLLTLLRRRLLGSLSAVFRQGAQRLNGNPAASRTLTVTRLGEYLGNDARLRAEYYGGPHIEPGFEKAAVADYPPYIDAMVRRPFRLRLALRTLLLLTLVGSLVFGYVYLLASLLVTKGVATNWAHTSIPTRSVHLFDAEITLHGGPYLTITALLSALALGAFLALVVTDENYSATVTESLIHEPVRECLLIALPYVRLHEQALLSPPPAGSGPLAPPSPP